MEAKQVQLVNQTTSDTEHGVKTAINVRKSEVKLGANRNSIASETPKASSGQLLFRADYYSDRDLFLKQKSFVAELTG